MTRLIKFIDNIVVRIAEKVSERSALCSCVQNLVYREFSSSVALYDGYHKVGRDCGVDLYAYSIINLAPELLDI